MREIKFRQWHYNRFIYHDLLAEYEIYLPADEPILQQYTGLKDKNGIEIYEGDIIRLQDYDEFTIINVLWKQNIAGFNISNKYDTVVIGNIYENQELL